MTAEANEQRILITQAHAGMVLSRPVILPNKITLCCHSTELDDDLIQRFIVRGIKRIFIQGHPIHSASMQPLQTRIDELNLRFSRITGDARMHFLRQAIEEEMSK